MNARIEVDYNSLSVEERKILSSHTSKSYLKVIVSSVARYNYRAQLDLANILLKEYLATQDRDLQISLQNKIYSLWFELCDQIQLVFRLAENPSSWQGYVNSSNATTAGFFKDFADDPSLERICRAYSLDMDLLRAGSLVAARDLANNLSKLADMYEETSNMVGGSNAVKHGYKVIYRDEDTEELFPTQFSDHLVISGTKKITGLPSGATSKEILHVGTYLKMEDERESLKRVVSNMQAYSSHLREMAECKLLSMEDPYYYLRPEIGMVKIGSNEICPCKSQYNPATGKTKKYKHCHGA